MSPLLKPIFSAKHHWAMEKGKESLELELERRHAKTSQERALVPEPPGPVFYSGLMPKLVPAAIVVIVGALALKRLASSEDE